MGEFRALALERQPVAIQHWSLRRIALGVLVLALAVVAALVILHNWAVVA
jgi:hypothetical protein